MRWSLGVREPAVGPEEAGIWAVSAQGTGTQELIWSPEPGQWSLVVMRADAGRGVVADVAVAATLPWLDDVGRWSVTGGVLLLVAAGACTAMAVRRRPARR